MKPCCHFPSKLLFFQPAAKSFAPNALLPRRGRAANPPQKAQNTWFQAQQEDQNIPYHKYAYATQEPATFLE